MKKKKGFRLKHLLLFLFIFWLGKSLISQRVVIKDAEKEIMHKKEEIAKIQREIEELNNEIEEKDSLDFVEKTAREELKMVKPREIMYIDKNKDKRPFVNPRN
ncbi:MAG: septum formation initiator family protein [Tissierellia bacterium]|nr:septum formation initiator family protein [Tissierellia bacterium]